MDSINVLFLCPIRVLIKLTLSLCGCTIHIIDELVITISERENISEISFISCKVILSMKISML
jgi:hypothetical protein